MSPRRLEEVEFPLQTSPFKSCEFARQTSSRKSSPKGAEIHHPHRSATRSEVRVVPSISVILPFLSCRFLEAAVESVLRQTRTLLVENGEQRLRLDSPDPRLVLLNEPRCGIVHALNRGLAHARAPLVARMDADDVCLPARFERQWAYLEEHPECLAVGSAALMVDPEGDPLWVQPWTAADSEIPAELLSTYHRCRVRHCLAYLSTWSVVE